MTREELEAAIWRQLRVFHVTVDNAVGFVDSLIDLALTFAAGDSADVTAARRSVLEREVSTGESR